MNIEKTCSASDVLEMGKEIFFPDGFSRNQKLDAKDYDFNLSDFAHDFIDLNKTVEQMYAMTHLKRLRLYVCTTSKTVPLESTKATSTNGLETVPLESTKATSTNGLETVPLESTKATSTNGLVISNGPSESTTAKAHASGDHLESTNARVFHTVESLNVDVSDGPLESTTAKVFHMVESLNADVSDGPLESTTANAAQTVVSLDVSDGHSESINAEVFQTVESFNADVSDGPLESTTANAAQTVVSLNAHGPLESSTAKDAQTALNARIHSAIADSMVSRLRYLFQTSSNNCRNLWGCTLH